MTPTQQRELQLLGAIYAKPETTFPKVFGITTGHHFTHPDFKAVWIAMHDAFDSGEDINIVTLMARGVPSDVCEMLGKVEYGAPAESLARTLAEEYAARFMVEGCAAISRKAAEREELTGLPRFDVQSLGDSIKQLAATVEEATEHGRLRSISENLKLYREFVDRNAAGDRRQVMTGYEKLDRATFGGFALGELVLLGGQPRTGKTSLVLNAILRMLDNGDRVGFIEGEMTQEQIFTRFNAIWSNADKHDVMNGKCFGLWNVPFEQWMQEKTFFFEEANDRNRNARGLKVTIERMTRAGCRIVFVDYLQCFRDRSGKFSEYEAVSALITLLRGMALRLNIVLFVLASLNRDVDSKTGRATLSSFRGSGELEFNASTALMLHRKTKEEEESDGVRKIELEIIKNREGREGLICLEFTLNTQRMREVEPWL